MSPFATRMAHRLVSAIWSLSKHERLPRTIRLLAERTANRAGDRPRFQPPDGRLEEHWITTGRSDDSACFAGLLRALSKMSDACGRPVSHRHPNTFNDGQLPGARHHGHSHHRIQRARTACLFTPALSAAWRPVRQRSKTVFFCCANRLDSVNGRRAAALRHAICSSRSDWIGRCAEPCDAIRQGHHRRQGRGAPTVNPASRTRLACWRSSARTESIMQYPLYVVRENGRENGRDSSRDGATTFRAIFPDFPGAGAGGSSFEELERNAKQAVERMYAHSDELIPAPTDDAQLRAFE